MLFLLEIIFRLLPVTTGFDYQNTPQPDPILRAKVSSTRHSLDWKFHQVQTRKVNNYGFPDDVDYAPNHQPIAVIGDSFVQSLMLPYPETLQGQLGRLLKTANHPVYSFGVPGYSLASYIGGAEYASKTFQPQLFVFLLTEEDITSSLTTKTGGSYFLNSRNLELEFKPTTPSQVTKIILKSALVRYLIFHLQIKPPGSVAKAAQVKTDLPSVTQLSHRLLNNLEQKSTVRPDNTIFIIDCDHDQIYAHQPQPQISPGNQLALFAQIAQARGYNTVDTLPLFTRQYQQSHRRLDFKPLDIHWNQQAHQLVAEAVYPLINTKLAQIASRAKLETRSSNR
jgi:hypothetical protein